MVSTDDAEIANIAVRYGAKVPFLRSEKTSDDFSTTVDVILEVLHEYHAINMQFDYACCLYPTAPFVSSSLLKKGFEKLKLENIDTLFPIVKYSFPIQRSLKIESNLLSLNYPEFMNSRSQDLQENYHDAGQFYWFNVERFEQEKNIISKKTGFIILSDMEVQDIDTIDDWNLAELKYQLLNNR